MAHFFEKGGAADAEPPDGLLVTAAAFSESLDHDVSFRLLPRMLQRMPGVHYFLIAQHRQGLFPGRIDFTEKGFRLDAHLAEALEDVLELADVSRVIVVHEEPQVPVAQAGWGGAGLFGMRVQKVINELALNTEVTSVDDPERITSLRVLSLPQLVIDGQIIDENLTNSFERIKDLLRAAKEKG